MSNISSLEKNEAGNGWNSALNISGCNDLYHVIHGDFGRWTSFLTANHLLSFIVKFIACPFTVLFNVLVIAAVKKRPRLQSNTNILLACLAVTDVFTGLVVEPMLLAQNILNVQLALQGSQDPEKECLLFALISGAFRSVIVSSLLHVTLVTFERFVAINFTMRYTRVITIKNIKIAVVSIWTVSILLEMFRFAAKTNSKTTIYSSAVFAFVIICCVLFIVCCYVMMFRETSRHRRYILTHQTPQDEVRRFLRENKALKTTAYVFGALIICYAPLLLFLTFIFQFKVLLFLVPILRPWIPTLTALNSLLNPFIYCWRQKEMRKFVFRNPCSLAAVGPD